MRSIPALLLALAAPAAARTAGPYTVVETGERFGKLDDALMSVRGRDATILVAPGVHRDCGVQQAGRITFRAEPDEVLAFQHMGEPYFKASWGGNVVGLLLDDDTDWEELAELLTDSYCIQAPAKLADQVPRPG